MTNEVFQYYLKEIEVRYGTDMKQKIETLHSKGHLGKDICLLLIGNLPEQSIVLDKVGLSK